MEREYKFLVVPLKRHFQKAGNNNPIIDFKIKGGKIDVINYNRRDKVFDIAECKIAKNAVGIGQTFGQALAYSSIIKDDGWRFFEALLDKARNWLTASELNKIFTERRVKARLWVCFEQKWVIDKNRLITELKNKIRESIGIILIDKDNIKITHDADELSFSIQAVYNKKEFYEKLREEIKSKISNIRLNKDGRYHNSVKFNFVHPNIHFEVWIKKKEATNIPIEIGLHMECGKVKRSGKAERNRRIFYELSKRKRKIKNELPNVIFEKWGQRVDWYKIYEMNSFDGDIKRIPEEKLRDIEKILLDYIETLKPILDEINWGKKR